VHSAEGWEDLLLPRSNGSNKGKGGRVPGDAALPEGRISGIVSTCFRDLEDISDAGYVGLNAELFTDK
jgi:hypothetical protein